MRRNILAAFFLATGLLCAQEYRATLLGVVSDPTGANVPEATVAATNIETSVRTVSKTNNEGSYVIPLLLPGKYRVTVEHPGFKTFERSPIELRLNDRTRVDVALEVGQVSDRVTVTAEAALLEVASSNRGQHLDTRTVADLPLNGRNPYTIMALSASAMYVGNMIYQRPFGEGSAYTINGGRIRTNEFQLDGVANNYSSTSSTVMIGYVPPVEATQEVKIQTNTYDAQYGRTGGGVMNLSVKSGTNRLHGAGYEYMRRARLEANLFANNAAGKPRPRHTVDQYGFEVDGPVMLPKVYRGKDRTFFMFALERYREPQPLPVLGSVPTAEQKKGDFSQTLTSAGRLYTIYDPLTIRPNPAFDPAKSVTMTNLQYLRTPFSGNLVPQNRMEPIAVHVLGDIPLPNQTGDPVTHANNWYGANAYDNNTFQNAIGRVDHTFNQSWRVFARWSHSMRDEYDDYWAWGTAANQYGYWQRGSDAAAFDVAGTLSPYTVLNLRLGFNRNLADRSLFPLSQDISALGFPKALLSQLQMSNIYPVFSFETYLSAGPSINGDSPTDTILGQATLLKIHGRHSMKLGGEFRLMHLANVGRSNASGSYSFTRSWTSSNPQVTDPNAGNAIASFLLGYMSGGSATLNVATYLSWIYPELFFQDDWQVSRKLTLNLGLRWDYESSFVERYNRQNRGFDFTARSPYQVPGLDLHGGLLFAGVGGQPRGAFDPDKDNIQPRVGVAYKMFQSKPLVFRGGVGRYFLPTTDSAGTAGFSQTTNSQTSTADYLPFQVLSNPFPNGLIQPPGSARGLATQVGDSVSFADPRKRIPGMWQYTAGFQYEVIPGLLLEASYIGSQTLQLQVSKSMSYLTTDQLALGTAYLSQSVANPFYGVLPPSTSRGAQSTIQRRNLMTQFPQFTGVTMNNTSLGKSWFNAFECKVEHRFKNGLSFLVSYRVSKTMETISYLNAQDTKLSRELFTYDVPQRFLVSGIYEFPIGPQKRWVNHGVLAHIVGGWEFNWSSLTQSGLPMSYPDYYIYGNPKLKSGQGLNHWFDTSPQIWVQRPPDTLRTTPLRSPNIRRYSAPQVDLTLIRDFRIKEGQKLQFRVTAYNASNTPIFNFPNTSPTSSLFGVVPITQINGPRSVDVGFRYVF